MNATFAPPTLMRTESAFWSLMSVSFGCFFVFFEVSFVDDSEVLFPELTFVEELIPIEVEKSRKRSAYRAAARVERAAWLKILCPDGVLSLGSE